MHTQEKTENTFEAEGSTPVRVGLFGGTFDPVHLGHLRMAEEVREHFSLSKVEFLPARDPPHKSGYTITPIRHRLAMLQKALEDNPFFEISDAEIRRDGPSFLVDTLRGFRRTMEGGSSLYFIMGMDSFLEISTWHRYGELFHLAHFVVVSRPGHQRADLHRVVSPDVAATFTTAPGTRESIRHESGHCVHFQQTTLLEISATGLRQRLSEGHSARYMVPGKVLDYIQEHSLYRQRKGTSP